MIRTRLWAFYDTCATADMPETSRLAATIETWWPAIEAFLMTKITNARTRGRQPSDQTHQTRIG